MELLKKLIIYLGVKHFNNLLKLRYMAKAIKNKSFWAFGKGNELDLVTNVQISALWRTSFVDHARNFSLYQIYFIFNSRQFFGIFDQPKDCFYDVPIDF